MATKIRAKARVNMSISGLTFDTANIIFMLLLCLTILYPFIYLTAISLTAGGTALSQIRFLPVNPTLNNYRSMVNYRFMRTGAINTIMRVVLGVSANLTFITLTAYPLSKRYLPHRPFWTGIFVFTMFFGGGMIPTYILFVQLKLINTIWSLVLSGMIPAFNVLLVRNFLMAIPDALEESARIDGAGDLRILLQILLPLMKPIIATVALWAVVGHWNAWFDSMIYMRDMDKQVLQVVMRNIVNNGSFDTQTNTIQAAISPESLKAAAIMLTTLPIICVYPFLQKYFVKGIMIGSLKG